MKIDELLKQAFEKNASDLHISAGQPPIVRIDGDLSPLSDEKVKQQLCRRFCYGHYERRTTKYFS